MTLPTGNHPRVHSSTHASHASHTHAAHAASKAKASLAAEEGEGGGFAAQLLKAQPAAARDVKGADAKPKAEAAKKPSDDKDGQASADAKDAKDGKDDKDAKAEAKPALDPAALLAQQQQQPVAPPTTSLADKTTAADDHDDFASDPLGALRKAASAKAGKDDGKAALMASLGAGKQPAGASAASGPGVGAKGATTGEISAALAKADEAVKAATDARDALAAMLPQPDPMAVQAGAVGAPSNALMDANQAASQAQPTPPAQATLPMPPQAPTFAPALGHQIDVWMKGGVQHAEVQLSPQDLGPIRVKIEMQGDQTRVHMSADVQSTRDALQQAMPQLSEQLGQVGISLTGGGVSDQPAFQQSQAQAQANAGGFGGSGRPGNGGSQEAGQGGLEEIAAASAARQMAQRRGLLDTYA